MANQDILYNQWSEKGQPKQNITLREIGGFASEVKGNLRSKGRAISSGGLNYAILKFILEYCLPSGWPKDLWEDFKKATSPTKGNYGIWKNYLYLNVNIKDEDLSNSFEISKKHHHTTKTIKADSPSMFSKSEYLDEDMSSFIEFIIDKIEGETFRGKKGWLEQLESYQWSSGNESFEVGIQDRSHFNYIVTRASYASGRNSDTLRLGVCNAVAGWGGLPPVSRNVSSEIFDSISYLRSVTEEDLIDCIKIFGERIATSSKLYYFSDPLNWAIYDSRVAHALSQLAYLFSNEEDEIFQRLKDKIVFPTPPTPSKKRKNPFGVQWESSEASLWFTRASVLLKAIANHLKSEDISSPSKMINPTDSWELYHVEMVFFRLGKEKFL